MGKGKRKVGEASESDGPRERQKRAQGSRLESPTHAIDILEARLAVPKAKHHTYFEFVENKDKKKKLEFQVTRDRRPPPGFEFVPIGNPVLTTACKEISREKDAMIFIVSNATENTLSQQVNRLGHHVRQTIVEEAKAGLEGQSSSGISTPDGQVESIPESEAEYHAQADAALRDLFPRIPNTDRQMIIDHSFTKRPGEQSVGFSQEMPLARRVQLAVLAHIRHNHTRYDALLREASWQDARKAVEALCLDLIVKWRGDEETGRDQLEEILREVVVISDDEEADSDEEMTDDLSLEDYDPADPGIRHERPPRLAAGSHEQPSPVIVEGMYGGVPVVAGSRADGHRHQRGFRRYRAWQDAIWRHRNSLRDVEEALTHDPLRPVFFEGGPYDTGPPQETMPVDEMSRPIYIGPSRANSGNVRHLPYRAREAEVRAGRESPELMPPSFVRPAHPLSRSRVPGPHHTVSFDSSTRHTNTSGWYLDPRDPRPATERIVVNATRPGTQGNPIVMEDRGGFYERVELGPANEYHTQPGHIRRMEVEPDPDIEIIHISGPGAAIDDNPTHQYFATPYGPPHGNAGGEWRARYTEDFEPWQRRRRSPSDDVIVLD